MKPSTVSFSDHEGQKQKNKKNHKTKNKTKKDVKIQATKKPTKPRGIQPSPSPRLSHTAPREHGPQGHVESGPSRLAQWESWRGQGLMVASRGSSQSAFPSSCSAGSGAQRQNAPGLSQKSSQQDAVCCHCALEGLSAACREGPAACRPWGSSMAPSPTLLPAGPAVPSVSLAVQPAALGSNSNARADVAPELWGAPRPPPPCESAPSGRAEPSRGSAARGGHSRRG